MGAAVFMADDVADRGGLVGRVFLVVANRFGDDGQPPPVTVWAWNDASASFKVRQNISVSGAAAVSVTTTADGVSLLVIAQAPLPGAAGPAGCPVYRWIDGSFRSAPGSSLITWFPAAFDQLVQFLGDSNALTAAMYQVHALCYHVHAPC